MLIEIGDRFIKAGIPTIVWEVRQLLAVNSRIPHVVLMREGLPNRQITLSVPALNSGTMYTKLDS